MICYLTRGLILEQAICALLKEYFESIHLENTYENFHVSVTNEHPFAELMFHSGLNAADSFPAVVVTTQEDRKPHNLDLPPTYNAIGIDREDLETITKTTETRTNKKGAKKEVGIPGLCTVVDEKTKSAILGAMQKNGGTCYGWSVRTRRRDSISIEIWAENNQLKNEIYEQTREFVTGNLRFLLERKYPFFAVAIFDGTVIGRRSNNYNADFEITLTGAHIGFDVDYCVEQIIIDTDLTKITEIITEADNYVKN